jgi:hypothetical protein
MNTKERGDIAVAKAISFFITNGYEVCLPLGDRRDYDLVVEKEGLLQKVQVKYAGIYSRGNVCKVGLRITGGNQSFGYSKKYKKNSFDFLYVYTQKDEEYLLPWDKITFRNELSIESKKYRIYKR